jgi:DNA mismatch repair ATPase MutS
MGWLDQCAGFCELRRSSLVSLPAQAFLLWDLHWLSVLERWQTRHGRQVRAWLETLGQLEAACALGGLHQLHPDWAFPEIDPTGSKTLRAEGLGHPLLPPSGCVRNDLGLGPPGRALLVTGSNMSGKSTLLRAIGLNLVLAQAGSVVCARALSTAPVDLGTSFRVHDSLARGVSTFLAELARLKQVVDRATQAAAAGRLALFLLDEILLGTNVVERQVAVATVLAHLLELGAIGAIATHDLSLADAPGLAGRLEAVHFTESYEQVDGQARMRFDYRLRPGIATSSNALELLALVGLGPGDASG